MRTPPSGGPARYARTRPSRCIAANAPPSPATKQPSSSQRRSRPMWISPTDARELFHVPPCQRASSGAMSRRMEIVPRQDQFDSMIQGLRDSADLLERLGRDLAVRRILVDVLGDLLNASMATVRFVASALLD